MNPNIDTESADLAKELMRQLEFEDQARDAKRYYRRRGRIESAWILGVCVLVAAAVISIAIFL
jgi:IS4 transposase